MNMDMSIHQNHEQTLIKIARILPHNRVEQLVDFARFLEAQILSEELFQGERVAEVEADNARWDTLLETDEAQALLEKLADEALREHRVGKARPMTFNDEGRIMPR